MYCTNCGQQLEDTANFCPNCGHSQNTKPKPRKNRWIFPVAGILAALLAVTLFLWANSKDPVPSLREKTTADTAETPAEKPAQTEAKQTAAAEVCPSCSGSGKCIACEGDGICYFCDGTGFEDCIWCWKTEICSYCNGHNEDCDDCRGTRKCTGCIGGKTKCAWCSGHISCLFCGDPGSGTCMTCDGTGKYNPEDNRGIFFKTDCETCEDGILRCDMCNGKGCYMCNGKGRQPCLFGPCDECDNGYYDSCDSCKGNGICVYCFGTYILDCPGCKDGITIDTTF